MRVGKYQGISKKRKAERKESKRSEKSKKSKKSKEGVASRTNSNGNVGGRIKTNDRTSVSKEAREKPEKNERGIADTFKDAWLGGKDVTLGDNDGKRVSENGDTQVRPGDDPSSFETGTLDYYEKREADFKARNPGEDPPDYYSEYGDRYVKEFDKLSPDLSEDGQEWVTETRENLQESFEDKIGEDPKAFDQLEQDPKKLREWAFDSHSDAYLDAGFADLPAEDIIKIATTPRFEDFFAKDSLKEAVEVGVQAFVDNPKLAATVPAEALKRVHELAEKGVIDLSKDVLSGVTDLAGSAIDTVGDAAGSVFDTAGDAAGAVLGGLGIGG
jgi:hypothetical protein